MVPFPMTLSDLYPIFQGQGVTVDALDMLYLQLMCDLLAIAKVLIPFGVCISLFATLLLQCTFDLNCKLTAAEVNRERV